MVPAWGQRGHVQTNVWRQTRTTELAVMGQFGEDA